MMNLDKLMETAKAMEEEIISWRRDFHSHPETAYEETYTSNRVAELLRSFGVDVETGIAKTGVVASIKGNQPGPCRALRCDLDALPIQEETGLPFASKNEGKMHACGHDSHIAMQLAAVKILSNMRDEIKGQVVFVFQPAEEGFAGAKKMIDDGLFEKYPIEFMFGHHIRPMLLPHGTFGTKVGVFSAISDRFYIDVNGKSGHAARPHLTVDPMPVIGEMITAINHIVSRNVNPFETAVVSIGTVHAGTTENIVAESGRITGTVRSFDEKTREKIKERLCQIVEHMPAAYGAEGKIEYKSIYPITMNNEKLANYVLDVAKGFWKEENVARLDNPTSGGNDFSFFAKKVPACMNYIGVNGTGGIHNSKLTFDESILYKGAAWEVFLALQSGEYSVK